MDWLLISVAIHSKKFRCQVLEIVANEKRTHFRVLISQHGCESNTINIFLNKINVVLQKYEVFLHTATEAHIINYFVLTCNN